MTRIAIIGGETHLGEVTQLAGSKLEISGAVVREDLKAQAGESFKCPIFDNETAKTGWSHCNWRRTAP